MSIRAGHRVHSGLAALACLGMMLWLCASAQALPLYGVSGFSGGDRQLLSINTATGAGTAIAPLTGATSIGGMTFVGSTLYGLDMSSDSLYTINTATGAATAVGAVGTDIVDGFLAYDSATASLYGGWGYGDGENYRLYTINAATGAATLVGGLGVDDPSGLAIAGDGTAYLLATHVNQDDQARLYTVDLATAGTTLVGALGPTIDDALAGLAFSGGSLYGCWNDTLYSISTSTGGASSIGSIGYTNVAALTDSSSYIPEPATLSLLGIGLAAAGIRARSRRRR